MQFQFILPSAHPNRFVVLKHERWRVIATSIDFRCLLVIFRMPQRVPSSKTVLAMPRVCKSLQVSLFWSLIEIFTVFALSQCKMSIDDVFILRFRFVVSVRICLTSLTSSLYSRAKEPVSWRRFSQCLTSKGTLLIFNTRTDLHDAKCTYSHLGPLPRVGIDCC